jgi:hypothetical protein
MQNNPTTQTITKDQILAAVGRVQAIAEAIRELGSVSDGKLYTGVMSHLSLSEYQAIIEILVKAKLVSNTGHMLVWIGGQPR